MMEEYIGRHQNTVAEYITTKSLLDLCEGLKRSPGVQVGIWCWEQAVLDMAEAREPSDATEEGDGGESLRRGSSGGLSGRSNRSEYKVAIYK